MAVFPLGSVLLPGQLLTLHVFENRYRVLMFDLHDQDPAEFVVVLIERGSEVGGGDVRAGIGCVARVLESTDLPDGRSLLAAVGTRRVSLDRWLEEDPYPRAEVTTIPDASWPGAAETELVDRVTGSARSLGALACELGAPAWPADLVLSDDPIERAWQLALLCPLGALDRQRLLGMADPIARWETLARMVDEQHQLLSAQIGWAGQ